MVEPYYFGAAVISAASYFLRLEAQDNLAADKNKNLEGSSLSREYDFIIVGGGTAGCILASKLSKHYTVLLLDQGGPPPAITTVPGLRYVTLKTPEINEFYYSVPQKYADNRSIEYGVSAVFSGSYSHNFLSFSHGSKYDYDIWAKLTKDSIWKYKHVRKIFKKLETYKGPFSSPNRGGKGPLTVATTENAFLPIYKNAASELGYTYGDLNGEQEKGYFGPVDFTAKNGRADTTYTAFIEPLIGTRDSLTLLSYAKVEKIIFDGNKIAKGVRFFRHGVATEVFASKEIVLTAGAIGSPLILWKSGIGPAKTLAKAKINVIADLPVGKKIQDHPSVDPQFKINDPSKVLNVHYNLTKHKFNVYLENENDGLLSVTPGRAEVNYVTKSAKEANEGNWPNMYFYHYQLDSPPNTFGISMVLSRPTSVGTLELNAKAYKLGERQDAKLVKLDFNYFDTDLDKKNILEGFKFILRLMQTKPFKKLNAELIPSEQCSSKYPDTSSDGYLNCFIATDAHSSVHVIGTCRMGYGKNDKYAVVDSKLRVIGIKRLRVADSSVIPSPPSNKINAPVMIVAETAAKEILKTYDREV